jgi:hypothetical protein
MKVLGIMKKCNKIQYLKCLYEDINKLVEKKPLLYKKWLNTDKQKDFIKYKKAL